ncbi:MAG: type II pantothenate kinase [Prevotellaceae bacterium]|nr:type II pantothenate kinase [Prevotellaceae bacterium]MDO4932191.1 type II pantothenate kinase [Prevotellaceae bacterium]
MIIGIDVGISTTKIVGVSDGEVVSPTRIKATDPVTSLYGAFGKYLYDNDISLADVERVMLTGVGAEYVDKCVYGLPTDRVGEFEADALGAQYGSGLSDMIVVSMGTGTTLIEVRGKEVKHLGGLGIGGGTLIGMAQLLLGTNDVNQISEMADKGSLANINLNIGDISARPLPGLPMDATASLFGNVNSLALPEDIALGLIWTVVQTIGSATVLASKANRLTEFVMIGNLTKIPQTKWVFDSLEPLYNVRFIIPKHSEFCTAIGAALKAVEGGVPLAGTHN